MDQCQEDMSFESFLRNRDVAEETIAYFLNEKVDPASISVMPEDDMKKWFPKYGDRLAVIAYCRKATNLKKQSLLEKLKEKMGIRLTSESDKKICASRKKKTSRKIALGWLCKTNNETFRQVRTAAGGGRREVSVELDTKCSDILEKCKELFFPKGKSNQGSIDLFDVELQDYKHNKCTNLEMTVGEIYEITGLNVLRFYLATSLKNGEADTDTDVEFIPETVVRSSSQRDRKQSSSISSNYHVTSEESLVATNSDDNYCNNDFPVYLEDDSAALYFSTFDENEFSYNAIPIDENGPLSDLHSLSTWPTVDNAMQESDRTIPDKLILHRGNVFKELIEAVKVRPISFKTVQIEMILPNGKPEVAEDIGGVLRDCITEFFCSFYEMCTMGADYKVPCLRHDLQKEEWTAIGKIIKQSFLSVHYFPIQIAPIFIKDCLGININNEEEVLKNFLKYISNADAKLIENALNNFDGSDLNDLLEFCNNYDAKWVPTEATFRKMLLQIANEELIQKPSFVKECFSPELQKIRADIDIENIYSKFESSDKNILSLFQFDENLSPEKNKIIGFLRKFIKESDSKTRAAFLRFCTGSDIPIKEIKIEFNETVGFSRVPISHTCSGLLELPWSYENFMVFRSEFNHLLNSNIWIMDIV